MNVACAGGEPLALTDCLNFGNPEKPEIGWELEQAIEGIARRRRVARHPRRLRERLALQRDRRRADPADAGRRLRRPRPRRDAHPRPLAERRPRSRCCAASVTASSRSSGGTRTSSRSRTTSPTAASTLALREAAAWSGRDRRRTTSSTGTGVIVADAPGRDPAGTTSSSSGASPDVRRLRRPRAGPRRRAAHVLRPLRAAAPRPGVGRDRGLRGRAADRAARPRARAAGLRRAEPLRPARRARDRAHALLDDRRQRLGERAAAAPPRPRAHGRARPQRQPRQRRRSCATRSASRSRSTLRLAR